MNAPTPEALRAMPPLRLGLTGGIGSGKSTVATLLGHMGAEVLDADAMSRASTAPGGRAMPAIRDIFGADFVAPDGGLDRDRMRAHVFAHPEARQQLEAIVHPCVHAAMRDAVAASRADWLVFDVPLLVESPHWRQRVDAVWVVDCDTETQIARVMARSGWNREAVLAVIRQQAPRERRLGAADAVLFNGQGTTMDTLTQRVRECARTFRL